MAIYVPEPKKVIKVNRKEEARKAELELKAGRFRVRARLLEIECSRKVREIKDRIAEIEKSLLKTPQVFHKPTKDSPGTLPTRKTPRKAA